MGLGDLVSKILVEVKGDTSDLKSKIKELSGEEKKLAQAQLDAAEKRNKSLSTWVDKLGKVSLALDTVGKGADYAKESLKEAGEYARLTAATAQVNIDKLSASFRGLVNEHDLLTFAAQTSHGALRLNQEEMETVGKAAVALQARGFDLTETIKKLTDAAVKGKAEGLDDLGLSLKDGESKAGTLKNIMAELNRVIADTGTVSNTTADSIQRASVQWDNMTSSVKRASAELFVAADTLDEIKQKLADRQWQDFMNVFGVGQQRALLALNQGVTRGRQNVLDSQTIEMPDMDLSGDIRKRREEARKRLRASNYVGINGTDTAGAPIGYSNSLGQSAVYGGDEQGLLNQIEGQRTAGLTADWMKRVGAQQEKKTTFLESTFGKIDDFNAYATAFSTLTGAVSAGLDAWIDGSMSAGQAIKKFLADALKGLASQMAVEALKHTAYALGSLAFGDVKGAATHGAAAAAFGVAAIGAAAAAKGLGGGGGQQSASGGGGSYAGASGGGGSSQQGSTTNYIITGGDPFGTESPRMMQRKFQRVVDVGTSKTSVGGSF